MGYRIIEVVRAWMLALLLVMPLGASAEGGQPFSKEQLEQLVAPIALYPDSLLAQVLMAATYPTDVAAAAKWSAAHKDMKGDDAIKAVESESWDPAVKSLVGFPQVLYMMGEKPDWVQNLGDAFLASSKDVLDAAQRLRTKAKSEGNLKSNEQQKVVVEQQASTQVIKIEPANPEVVYVPSYNPTVVYGTWPYAAYPPYYPPPYPYYYPGAALATGIAFGIGVGIVNGIWGGCNWGGGDIDIDVNKYNNINRNNKITNNNNKFQHNSANRKGVPYRDSASQQKYGKNVPGASDRQDFRGKDSARDAQRQQAQNSLQQRGMDPATGRDQLRNDPQTRERAQSAARDTGRAEGRGGEGGFDRSAGNMDRGGGGYDRGGSSGSRPSSHDRAASGGRDNAFSGAGNGSHNRQSMDRGASSRSSMGGGGFGGGGGGMHRGGGGGRGGRR